MRATFEAEPFRKAFALAARAAMPRGPKPILSNVRLDASEEGVWLSATNLEVGVRVPVVGCQVDRPGSCLLPASEMGDILKTADSAYVSLDLDDRRVTVLDGMSKFRLASPDPDEFPEVPAFSEAKTVRLPAASFLTAARRVLPCVDTDARKAGGIMSGVFLDYAFGPLSLVATNGRVLARCECPAEGESPADALHRIVPAPAMATVLAAFDGREGELEIDLSSPSDARFRCEGVELSCRLISGRFPRYGDAIPTRLPRSAEMACSELRRLAERAAISANAETRAADFRLGLGRLGVESASERSDASAVAEVAADFAEVTFRLNLSYLVPALKALGDDTPIRLQADTGRDPVGVRADGYLLIIMPITVDEAANAA